MGSPTLLLCRVTNSAAAPVATPSKSTAPCARPPSPQTAPRATPTRSSSCQRSPSPAAPSALPPQARHPAAAAAEALAAADSPTGPRADHSAPAVSLSRPRADIVAPTSPCWLSSRRRPAGPAPCGPPTTQPACRPLGCHLALALGSTRRPAHRLAGLSSAGLSPRAGPCIVPPTGPLPSRLVVRRAATLRWPLRRPAHRLAGSLSAGLAPRAGCLMPAGLHRVAVRRGRHTFDSTRGEAVAALILRGLNPWRRWLRDDWLPSCSCRWMVAH
ncbi:hypothetical protein SAMN05421748_101458 [Paractinoplanes atraurantiacus]|uniref:Uncharacterized protein n=1 Tax=Paractinoplanes atraurantiacus TaxID=1036182 RepID=A0A285F280_9ACTN|nr:hypothetical protein SAMN05421748_101458 [Actinoplanes atraurantiacus]